MQRIDETVRRLLDEANYRGTIADASWDQIDELARYLQDPDIHFLQARKLVSDFETRMCIHKVDPAWLFQEIMLAENTCDEMADAGLSSMLFRLLERWNWMEQAQALCEDIHNEVAMLCLRISEAPSLPLALPTGDWLRRLRDWFDSLGLVPSLWHNNHYTCMKESVSHALLLTTLTPVLVPGPVYGNRVLEFFRLCAHNHRRLKLDVLVRQLTSVDVATSLLQRFCEEHRFVRPDAFVLMAQEMFVDTCHYLKNFARTIRSAIQRVRTIISADKVYAPYLAVCQSSGYGKTRMALELRNEGFFVAYGCFRAAGTEGLPSRSAVLADMLMTCTTEQKVVEMLTRWTQCMMKWALEQRATGTSLAQLSTAWYDYLGTINYQLDIATADGVGGLDRVLREWYERVATAFGQGPAPTLVFVFDEARSLLTEYWSARENCTMNVFRLIRRVLRNMTTPVFALFMDTTSSVTRFAPSRTRDPSQRGFKESLMFPPYIVMPTQDVMPLPASRRTENVRYPMVVRSRTMMIEVNAARLVHRSRPMYVERLRSLGTVDQVIAFAEEKLSLIRRKRDDMQEDVHIAEILLAARFGMFPVNKSTVEALVSSAQATLLNVTEDRETLHAQYLIEPVIGMACSRYLMRDDHFPRFLDSVHRLFAYNAVTVGIGGKGPAGEFLCMLFLSHAMDVAAQQWTRARSLQTSWYLGVTVPLGVWLSCLYGATLTEVRAQIGAFADAHVCFYQFGFTCRAITRRMLQLAMQRRGALICPPMQPGIDLVIPLLLPAQGVVNVDVDAPSDAGVSALQPERLGALLVHVKNYDSTLPELVETVQKMDTQGCKMFGLPTIRTRTTRSSGPTPVPTAFLNLIVSAGSATYDVGNDKVSCLQREHCPPTLILQNVTELPLGTQMGSKIDAFRRFMNHAALVERTIANIDCEPASAQQLLQRQLTELQSA